jgi:uncharacterized protein
LKIFFIVAATNSDCSDKSEPTYTLLNNQNNISINRVHIMKKLFFSSALFLLTACVTINIYFPAAAAEKAADTIIKEIQKTLPEKTPEPKASLSNWQVVVYQWADDVLNVIVTPAQAAEADLEIDSADIRKLRATMKSRFDSLADFYQQGFIGIKQTGLLVVRDASSVPLKDRNTVNNLVSAENSDREALYRAIANANGHGDWYEQIKTTFAARWISNAQAGWWYETSSNNWKQK